MDISRHCYLIAFVAALLASFSIVSVAQESDSIKIRYDRNTGIPDNVFLYPFIESILREVPTDDRGHDHDHRAVAIHRNLDTETYEKAVEVMDFLIAVRDDIRTKKVQFMRTHVCPLDTSRPTGQAVFASLDAVDENTDKIGAEYLNVIKATLPPVTYSNFLLWMADAKQGSYVTKYDHKKLYANHDPNMVRQDICGTFDSGVAEQQRRIVQ